MPTSLNIELEKDDRLIHIKAIGQRGYGRTLPTVTALLDRLAKKPKPPAPTAAPANTPAAQPDLLTEFTTLAKELAKQLHSATDAQDWFDPAAGLKTISALAEAIRKNPKSLGKLPGHFDTTEILDDLETLQKILTLAQQRKTRFRFITV